MTARVGEVVAELKANPPPLPVGEIAEAIQFLEWLIANNFTFLGVREYALRRRRGSMPSPRAGLGILRSPDMRVLRRGDQLFAFTPDILAFLRGAEAAHRHQVERALARAPAVPTWTMSA